MKLTREQLQEWVDDVYEPEERDGMFRILWMDNYCHPEDIEQQYNEYLISKKRNSSINMLNLVETNKTITIDLINKQKEINDTQKF